MKKAENSYCLLLNADYAPLKIISWRKAILWSIKQYNYNIEIIEYYQNRYIRGVNKLYDLPLIARSLKYLNFYNYKPVFSRKNLFIRDNHTCQYCGIKFLAKELTYDHIIPKSRFHMKDRHKATNWTNVVTSCYLCNKYKANKTPDQASMKLINQPITPRYDIKYLPVYHDLSIIDRNLDPEHQKWNEYLYDYISK